MDPKRVIYSDNWRLTIHYREAPDGYSIVIKEERLFPRRRTVYVYHIFINRQLVVKHAHYKYISDEPPATRWLELEEGTEISPEQLASLLGEAGDRV